MTDKEVLQKAIDSVSFYKEDDDGYPQYVFWNEEQGNVYARSKEVENEDGWGFKDLLDSYGITKHMNDLNHPFEASSLRGFLLSELFAKAFWGEAEETEPSGVLEFKEPTKRHLAHGGKIADHLWFDEVGKSFIPSDPKCWRGHLQRMVLEENPIDYLRKFIKE